MRAMTAEDHRVAAIREQVAIHGRWCSAVEAAVCEAIDSAFDEGIGSVGIQHARYRILRWVARHDGGDCVTHQFIADACGTTRETVTRHLGRLRRAEMLEGSCDRLYRQSYRLTQLGRDFAGSMDSIDLRNGGRPFSL